MNRRIVGNTLGKVLLAEAALLLLPMTAALFAREPVLPFLSTILLLLVSGFLLTRIRPRSPDLFAREGFVCVGLSWILMSLFGALPFVFSGDIPHLIDAWFETVSGFTTTGASILENPELLSRGCLFWRLFTHWIGGMGVLVFIAAVLPVSGDSYIHIMRAEVPGPTVSKLVPRVRKTARILYLIYLVLTALECLLLVLGGMSFYEALLHSFATAGTGGFSTRAASIDAYQSVYIEMVIAVFMLLFGCNFNLFYLVLIGQASTALQSEELRVYLGIIAGAVLLIALNIMKGWRFRSVAGALPLGAGAADVHRRLCRLDRRRDEGLAHPHSAEVLLCRAPADDHALPRQADLVRGQDGRRPDRSERAGFLFSVSSDHGHRRPASESGRL